MICQKRELVHDTRQYTQQHSSEEFAGRAYATCSSSAELTCTGILKMGYSWCKLALL